MPMYHIIYFTPTNHDLGQVQISLDNNVKWSNHFPFLFINRLKIAWERHKSFVETLICGAIWICGLSHFINQITFSLMLNYYKSTAQNRAAPKVTNGNQYSIHLHLCIMHNLLFHSYHF